MPLISNGAAAQDEYARAADGAPLPQGPVLVSLERFFAEREMLLARNEKVGVALASEQSPEDIGADVNRLALIALNFPTFKDGRAFSWARLLRTRLKFQGTIRATGAFLPDQIAYLARVGVTEFDGDARITPEAVAHALAEMTDVYQPAADGKTTIRELRAR